MLVADIAIRRPVMTVMVISSLILLGAISIGRLGVDLFPKVEFPYIIVQTKLDGASPEVIETEVTDLLEEEINATEGIKSLTSVSSDGFSSVRIEFKLDANPDVKAQEVRHKVDRVLSELPAETEAPVVQKMDPDADPIVTIMISGDMAIRELTEFADKQIKERLQRLEGVGGVAIVGGREREIRIWVNALKLRSYQVSVQDIINAVRREHAEIPGGRLDVNKGYGEYTLKTKGELTHFEDFGEIVVAKRGRGIIRLKDLARVSNGMEDERTYAEFNGKQGVALEVRRQSGKNTVAVVQQVQKELAKIRAEAPKNINIVTAKDISRFISSSIEDVKYDLMLGIVLVVIVTLCFLLNMRATVIVAAAIPTSLISTFFAFYVLDFSINMMTMMALSVAIGILVDDAIVVLESIYTHLEQGMRPMEAASKGTAKVGGAVVAGTLSIMGVFVSVAFIEGVVGRFFHQYGLTIVFSVGISLLVSLTLTPMLCSRWLKDPQEPRGLFAVFENMYQVIESAYKRVLAFALKHSWSVLLLALLSIFVGAEFASRIPMSFASKTDRSEFSAFVEMPLGTGIEETKRVGHEVAKIISGVEHVNLVFMAIGSGAVSKTNNIDFYIGLTHKSERDIPSELIMDQVRSAVVNAVPQAKTAQMADIPWIGGGGGGMFNSDMHVVLQGPELSTLQSLSEHLLIEMQKQDIYRDIRTTFDLSKPEVHIEIDRKRAADLGISVRDLATTIRATAGGQDVATYQEGGSRYDVRLRLEEYDRDKLQKLNLIQIRSADGNLIDLASVATFKINRVPVQIDRRDRSRQISVMAMAAPGIAVGSLKEHMDAVLADLELPSGYTAIYSGTSEQLEETGQAIAFAFGMALIALYMILASQFNSFGQPMVIMLTAPLSFIGAFATVYMLDAELSLFAQIGLIALMGLVMKNGILLVDYANQLRPEGFSAHDAMLNAGKLRLRPVLMTAFSTIFGMIPVAFSTSDGAEFRTALGLIIIGGLASSTLLTLLVVPVAYTLYDDMLVRIEALKAQLAKHSNRLVKNISSKP
ncbi:MAG: efflux RND transporter permease subunit [Pseudomonadales bacterium]|nr:efflux RND transporter permease subunit [Pseudomonadales bacterium]